MALRTDLAMETAARVLGKGELKGIKSEKETLGEIGLEIIRVKILDEEGAKKVGKPVGEYVTVKFLDPMEDYSPCFEGRAEAVAGEIKRLCPHCGSVLAVGLGNRHITPDAVGPLCAEKIFPTAHIKKFAPEMWSEDFSQITVIETGVMGQTGIEASRQTAAVCREISPERVIAVDALACSELENLGRTVQICNTGISPGSGVENARKELSKATLGVECIAIGVPTVVDMSTVAEQLGAGERPECGGMMVTPRNIDKIVESAAKYIAYGINRAFLGDLTVEEITSLVE